MPGILSHHYPVRYEARPSSSLFPPYAETCVTLRHVFDGAWELTLSRDVLSAGSIPSDRKEEMLG